MSIFEFVNILTEAYGINARGIVSFTVPFSQIYRICINCSFSNGESKLNLLTAGILLSGKYQVYQAKIKKTGI